MTTITTFDDLLSLGATGAPMPYFCKAWKRTVLIKDPTAEDLDVWRMYCNRNKAADAPFSARLLQIMLVNDKGEPIVPPGDEGLDAVAMMPAAGVAEVAEAAMKLMNGPTEEEVEELEKNSDASRSS
jgi:hypothetical protein